MPLYALPDADENHPAAAAVASGPTRRELREWVERLPAENAQELWHLIRHGWTQEPQAAAVELADGLAVMPPSIPGVREAADRLLAALRASAEATVLS